jgi:hypothetical protein
MRLLLEHRLSAALMAALLVGVQALWDQAHGGVPSHHLLARGDLPGISNLWGLLTVPLLTWLTLTLVDRRVRVLEGGSAARETARAGLRLLGAFLFGCLLAVLWEFRQEAILQYLVLLPLAVALFIPVSRPEQLLGFVLGMSYTFGGVLPILVGLVLMTLGAVVHHGLRGGACWVVTRLRGSRRLSRSHEPGQ